jgi:hypothetical protein
MDVRRIFMAVVLVGGASASHEAVAAGQAGWSGGTTQQPATNFDRYGQPTTVPSISQRTQGAVSDTGNALRDGMEAGIRAGELTLGTGNTQPQSSYLNRAGGAASPWPTTPAASSAAPAWPSNAGGGAVTPLGTAPLTSTPGGGWTSIGTGIAAPKLLVPQSPMTTTNSFGSENGLGTTSNFGNASTQGGRGPNFPAVAANEQPQLHSVLSDPSRSPPATTKSGDDWINNWNNNSTSQNAAAQPVTIGRNGSSVRDPDLVPLRNGSTAAQDPRGTATNQQGESWSNSTDPWGRNGSAPATTAATAGFGNSPIANQPVGQFAGQTSGQGINGPQQNGPNMNGYTQAGFGTPSGTMGNGQSPNGMNAFGRNEIGINGPMTTQPVFTWVLVVLALAASLAANFYLGASYLDARQKYQSLVRKTAETFRRVKAAAT